MKALRIVALMFFLSIMLSDTAQADYNQVYMQNNLDTWNSGVLNPPRRYDTSETYNRREGAESSGKKTLRILFLLSALALLIKLNKKANRIWLQVKSEITKQKKFMLPRKSEDRSPKA